MLKKLVIRESSNAQREFAERTANLTCHLACKGPCGTNPDVYIAVLQWEWMFN